MQTNYYRKKANPNTGTTIFEMNAGFHEQFIPLLGIKDQKKFVLKPMLLRGGFFNKEGKNFTLLPEATICRSFSK